MGKKLRNFINNADEVDVGFGVGTGLLVTSMLTAGTIGYNTYDSDAMVQKIYEQKIETVEKGLEYYDAIQKSFGDNPDGISNEQKKKAYLIQVSPKLLAEAKLEEDKASEVNTKDRGLHHSATLGVAIGVGLGILGGYSAAVGTTKLQARNRRKEREEAKRKRESEKINRGKQY